MMPAKDWEVINDDWAEHDFCSGAQQGDRYPYIITDRYGPIASLPDFVRKAQLANYECFRAMYEGRFAKLFNPETGVITWMSSPAQPSFVWQLYSHDLEPNSSLYGARKACEPVHIMLNQKDWHVMVVNNTPEPLKGLTAKTIVYNLEGRVQYTHSDTATAAPSAATDIGAVDFPSTVSAVHFIKLELRDGKGALLSDNFYWRAAPGDEDNFQALNTLPTVALDIQATRHDNGGKCLLEVVLRNPSQSIALMSHLQLRKARSGQRVLPVFYSDNYVSLLPGERKTLTVEAAASDLGGDAPLLALDGWNVTVNPTSASRSRAVQVVPNAEAQVSPTAVMPANAAGEVLGINCGGSQIGFFRFGAPPPAFAQDYAYQGGKTDSVPDTGKAIDTQAPNAAPPGVYQCERWGKCTYTFSVKQGPPCTVRLHFAEFKFEPGQRKFNVDINGRRVLTDYDIAAEGGKDKAVVKDFPAISPDANGNIVIAFTRGSADEPKICGIQILR
jgi:hypothetical protein